MRYTKVASIAAIVTLATTALAAGLASATATVCTNQVAHQGTEACEGSHGKHVKIGSEFSASLAAGTTAVLNIRNAKAEVIRTVTCGSSTVKGNLTTTTGGGSITGLTFESCSSPGCSNVIAGAPRTGKAFPWTATVTASGNTNGQIHVSNISKRFTATCLFIQVECEYEATTATSEIKGETSTIESNAVVENRVGGPEVICGKDSTATANYTITTPSSLFIS